MQGKHIAITGATAGIGRASALALAQRGARLTLFCRNLEKGRSLAEDIVALGGLQPTLFQMDMASLASVREAAAECVSADQPLDVLLNNAGVVNTERRLSADGFEETLAVNHFAPFLLTGLLLPSILNSPAGRIVNVASDAHAFVRGMNYNDMHSEQSYRTFTVYGHSKLANILFTRALAQRLAGTNASANCLHPGAVSTALGTQNPGLISSLLPRLLKPFFRTPEKGAQTSIYLCSSDEVRAVSGAYFANCKQVQPRPWARSDEAARELWDYTEQAVDFRYRFA